MVSIYRSARCAQFAHHRNLQNQFQKSSNHLQNLQPFHRDDRVKRQRQGQQSQLQIVRTSEYWYEEEDEFDSLTDALRSKNLILMVPGPDDALHDDEIASLRQYLQPMEMTAGFCGSNVRIINYFTAVSVAAYFLFFAPLTQ